MRVGCRPGFRAERFTWRFKAGSREVCRAKKNYRTLAEAKAAVVDFIRTVQADEFVVFDNASRGSANCVKSLRERLKAGSSKA